MNAGNTDALVAEHMPFELPPAIQRRTQMIDGKIYHFSTYVK